MKIQCAIIVSIVASLRSSPSVLADTPSAFGSGFDVQDFYKPFSLEEITPENMQKWPYYKHVSAHWDDYALHGTKKINRSNTPAKLEQGDGGLSYIVTSEIKELETLEREQETVVDSWHKEAMLTPL